MTKPGLTIVAGSDDASVSELTEALQTDEVVVPIRPAGGGDDRGVTFDRMRPATVESAFARVVAEFGAPRALVISPAVASGLPLSELSPAAWNDLIDNGLTLTMHLCRAAVPEMANSGGGRIMMILRSPSHASVAMVTSAASVCGFSRALAAEVGELGITVNAVVVPNTSLEAVLPALALLNSTTSGYITAEILRPQAVDAVP